MDAVPDRQHVPGNRLLLRSLLIWFACFAVSLSIYNGTYNLVSEVMIHRFQVVPSFCLIKLTLPGVPLQHTATAIRTPAMELNILRGCDGVEAWLLLVTALIAFPMPWRRRWLGVVYGTILIFSLNLARIVSLFHIALKKPEWMDLAHGVIWQSVIVLAAAIFVLVWMDPGSTKQAPMRDEK
jgi:exosortase/archaeosortase family protein